eukprot:CAMPEP_0119054046 /NCGR_PEP_ID=MMETSP1177-20130426/74810_1 /TAXON_ID=2985 /ORGANISM="Ochromonas sp, Strain CCMP1899" /LENGTH=146 /DNA_ID=CAMNT_0007034161 /DNA_START=2550 /DNA_END=2987 /DNA_ORIENTATION=-
MAIIIHLMISRRSKYSHVSKISPIAWMVDIFGPLDSPIDIDEGEDDHYFMEAATANDSNLGSSKKSGSSKKGSDSKGGGKNIWGGKKGPDPGVCIHEDGGRFAIFEKIEITQEISVVSPGVIKGPLYKVVSCACARDKKLKDKMEW